MATMRPGVASRQIERLFADGTVAGLSDGHLLDRFFNGRDEASFEALVARHGSMVLATCRGVLRDGRDVEDAFQATFLILIRKAGSVRGRDALGGWLHRVAHRVALQARADAERRRSRERRAAERGPTVSEPIDVGDDLRRVVHEELAMLSEAYRLPIVLCDLGDLTHAQAARELRWGEATLRRRLARARAILRDRLTRRGLAPTVGLLGLALVPSSVPAALVSSTVRAGVLLTTGRVMAGIVPATVIVLMKGLVRQMIKAELRKVAGGFVAIGFLAAGASWISDRGPGSSPDLARAAEPRAESPRNPVETTTMTYYVGDLIRPPGRPTPSGERPQVDMTPVIRLIVTSVAPGTWQGFDPKGQPIEGPDPAEARKTGLITPFFLNLSLIIRHTPEIQDQIANQVRLLRTIVNDTTGNSTRGEVEVALPKAEEEPGPAGSAKAKAKPFDPENDPDLKAELVLAESLAEMRRMTESLPILIEGLEKKLAAWEALLKKHNYGVPTELGHVPSAEEQKALESAERTMEELLGKYLEAKGKLSVAQTMQTALERRLPDRPRPNKAPADQESRLKEVERKLDLILKALEGKTTPGPD